MNSQSVFSGARQVLTAGAAVLAGYNLGNPEQLTQLGNEIAVAGPAIVSIGSILWSIYKHYRMVKVPESTMVKVPGGTATAKTAVEKGKV